MLGIILLIVSVGLYFRQKKWSILLYLLFMTGGFKIISDSILGVKSTDLAIIYTIIICFYSLFFEKNIKTHENTHLKIIIQTLFLFLLCSSFFSLIYYNFSIAQIIQGGRHLFLFLGYFFIRKLSYQTIEWLIKIIFRITFVHAILYIFQVIFDAPYLLLANSSIHFADPATGIMRYYNYPFFLSLFIFVMVFFPDYIQTKSKKYSLFVFFAALFCTQGRTLIGVVLTVLLLGLLLNGHLKRIFKVVVVVLICLMPFFNMIVDRYSNEGETDSDLNEIVSGKFIDRIYTGEKSGGTMSFRLALVYERIEYLKNRPFLENVFGLGMISDSQFKTVMNKYHFILGIENPETGAPYQLQTPDIAWGNLIMQFGYVGTLIMLYMWFFIAKQFFLHRNLHPMIFCCFLFVILMLLESFSTYNISAPRYFALPLSIMTLLTQLLQKRDGTQ